MGAVTKVATAGSRPAAAQGIRRPAAPGRPNARPVLLPGAPGAVLALQGLVGNRAVQRVVVTPDGTHKAFEADRFKGTPKLERCLNDTDRLRPGDPDSEAVRKVQQALIELGYDLGPSGADGDYGSKTAAAVKKFKADQNLGFTQFGDVGPGTMGRLDELLKPGKPPIPPTEEEPIITDGPPGKDVGPPPGPLEHPNPNPPFERHIVDLLEPGAPEAAASVQTDRARLGPASDLILDFEEEQRRFRKEQLRFFLESKHATLFGDLHRKAKAFKARLEAAIGTVVRKGVNAMVDVLLSATGSPLLAGVVRILRKAWTVVGAWFGGVQDPIDWVADKIARSIRPFLAPLDELDTAITVAEVKTYPNFEEVSKPAVQVFEVVDFVKNQAVPHILENVRRLYAKAGGFTSILRNLRDTLKRLGINLSDIPGIGAVDELVQTLDRALQPDVSPREEG